MPNPNEPHVFESVSEVQYHLCKICHYPHYGPIHQPRVLPPERTSDQEYFVEYISRPFSQLTDWQKRYLFDRLYPGAAAAAALLIEADVTCEWVYGQTCHYCNATEKPHYDDCVYWLFVQSFSALMEVPHNVSD